MTHALITKTHNGIGFTFREDGWFNMTKAAKAFDKNLSHFWTSPDTGEYVESLQEFQGDKTKSVFTAVRGVGTWAHPKLAVFFARWLDVKFAVWCDAVIDDILKGHAQVTVTAPEKSSLLDLPPEFYKTFETLVTEFHQVKAKLEALEANQRKTIKKPTMAPRTAVLVMVEFSESL